MTFAGRRRRSRVGAGVVQPRPSSVALRRFAGGCEAGGMSPSGAPRGRGPAPSGEMPWAAVPPEVADLVRPGLPGVVEDIIAAVRAEVVEYDQPLEGEFGRLIRQGATAALQQFVDLLGRDVDLPDDGVYEAIGRAEYRAGRTLDALQSAYRVGARVAWRAAAELAEAALDSRVLVVFAEAIFAYIDRLADAAVAGLRARAVGARGLRAGAASRARRAAAARRGARPRRGRACRRAGGLAAAGTARGGRARRRRSDAGGAPDAGRHDRRDAGRRRRPRRARSGRARAATAARGGPAPPARRARPDGRRGRARTSRRAARSPGGRCTRPAGSATTRWRAPTSTCSTSRSSPTPRSRATSSTPRLAPLRAMKPAARDRATETLRAWLDAHGDVTAHRAGAARPPAVGPIPARPPARGVRGRARRPRRAAGGRRGAARLRPARELGDQAQVPVGRRGGRRLGSRPSRTRQRHPQDLAHAPARTASGSGPLTYGRP